MKKTTILVSALLSVAAISWATETIWIKQSNRISLGLPSSMADNITLSDNGATVNFNLKGDAGTVSTSYTDIANVTFGKSQDAVTIAFDGNDADIINPYAFQGVSIEKTGGNIVINSQSVDNIRYIISGTTTDGSVTFSCENPFTIDLDGANITSATGSAINIQSKSDATINLHSSSSITDGAEGENGCLYSKGNITLAGDGTLNIKANTKHAIFSKQAITISSGSVNVTSAASDGIHSSTAFVMNGGNVTMRSIGGDCIDGDEGTIDINAGSINIEVSVEDAKGLKCDDALALNGGEITVNMPANQGKAFKSKGNITVSGSTINVTASGKAVVVDYDPSYCTVFKADTDFIMNSGNITINHSGMGGKGISCDGNATFYGGSININVTGNGSTYTASTGTDTYCSTCITSDGNIYLYGGNFNLLATGSAGKCIKADLTITADPQSGNSLVMVAETKGAQLGSSSSGGGGGNRPPGGKPGGGGTSSTSDSSSSPKVIKCEGTMTIKGGDFTIKSASEGGEGLESKSTVDISGGNFYFTTYDDCINAKSALNISGGNIRAVATGNDAIDSNNKMNISGGLILANGSREPEEGLDVDNANNISITGGIIINQKGNMLNLTTTQCKVPTVLYNKSITAGTLITLTDNNDKHIMSFKSPQNMSQGCYITHPDLKINSTYKIYTGGTVSGGTVFDVVTQGGTFSGGSVAKTFTMSSNLQK